MARVTVEDCVKKVPNKFQLVLVAAHRAKKISSGEPLTVARDNDKDPVVALREVAVSSVDPEAVKESCIRDQQKHRPVEENELEATQYEEEFGDEIDSNVHENLDISLLEQDDMEIDGMSFENESAAEEEEIDPSK